MNNNNNNIFNDAHSLPNYKHDILNTAGIFDTELLARHLEGNMGKKLKDIGFHFKESTTNYNNITAQYLQKESDERISMFGHTPRSKVIDRPFVDWVRNKQLDVPNNFRTRSYYSGLEKGK